MQKLVENEYATLKVYQEKKIVHHEFHKFMFGDNFKNFMLKAADVFVQNHCHKWLSDDRGNSALRQEDLEWAQQNWEPKIFKAGWKFWAIVLPEKVVGKMSMKGIIDRYKQMGVTVNIFSDPNLALAWLEKQ
ncbi:MAG: hypothetical protein H6612_12430 [Ignavibacteriales bacterium]|nr:hypothetical protein [Ignavibacteriales bacterium]MCB9260147.1 hypothetical protein [Ignavibacteriales bacterium]